MVSSYTANLATSLLTPAKDVKLRDYRELVNCTYEDYPCPVKFGVKSSGATRSFFEVITSRLSTFFFVAYYVIYLLSRYFIKESPPDSDFGKMYSFMSNHSEVFTKGKIPLEVKQVPPKVNFNYYFFRQKTMMKGLEGCSKGLIKGIRICTMHF